MNQDLTVSVIQNFDEFLNLQACWNELAAKGYANNPFLTFEWQTNWWRVFGDGKRLYILIVKEKNRDVPIAIAPLMIVNVVGFRIIQFIGTGPSDYLNFIIDKRIEFGPEVFFNYLYKKRKDWDIVFLSDILLDKGDLTRFSDALNIVNLKEKHRNYTISPYLQVKGKWEEFLSSKNTKFRSNLKGEEKRIEKNGLKSKICKINDTELDENIFRDIVDIERKSWKDDAGTSKIQQDKQREFYFSVLKAFSRMGWLNIWMGYLNNQAVSYLINFDYAQKIWYYDSSYDKSFKAYSMSSILIHHAIKDSFLNQRKEYDFLRGDEDYKKRWTSERRESFQIVIYKANLRSFLGFLILYRLRWSLARYPQLQKIRLSLKRLLHKLRNKR